MGCERRKARLALRSLRRFAALLSLAADPGFLAPPLPALPPAFAFAGRAISNLLV